MSWRDRDPLGRPRNARPRDSLGRPLERGATPGPDASPGPAGTPDPETVRPPTAAQALRVAQELLDAGRPFHAHEVLEDTWKAAPSGERELWRGLAQVAVGLTHARRGNGKGAVALLRRGGSAVGGYREEAPYGIDAAGVSERASRLADRIEREGLDQIPAAELALRLSRTA